ncbi:hypothetical protein R1sor_021851 [Riccia sorocarpa]|uniref:Uncharacterized protein n=1 Tax=Riccia sorocarpa TaxID=122646 RepID=A0ABD3GLI4_9MARC
MCSIFEGLWFFFSCVGDHGRGERDETLLELFFWNAKQGKARHLALHIGSDPPSIIHPFYSADGGMDKEHSLDWGRFELPAEFEIPPGYDILEPTYVPYGIHEGTVRMPSKKKCRIIPRADMRYRMEDPDGTVYDACSFWVHGDLKFLFPDGTYIYVDSLPPQLAPP